MTQKYANLTFTDSDYFGNVLRFSQWNSRDKLNKFQTAVDREKWEMSPQTVNAYYVSIKIKSILHHYY
jgi:predicted metalloendopeptidase